MWHYDSKGVFWVKSAYKVSYGMRDSPSTSFASVPTGPMWNSIWKAKVLGKIKMCVWRACRNILPTHSMLLTKGVAVDNTCLFCSSSPESVLHVFNSCPFAHSIYLAANLNLDVPPSVSTQFCEWFYHCLTSLSADQRNLFLLLIYSIWRARNTLLWEDKLENLALVGYMANLFLHNSSKSNLLFL